ncbi:MAG: DUF6476 family protein [Pseudomonadota bacterium]
MASDMDHNLTEPPQLRSIRIMVLILLGVMIAAIIVVATLFLIRFGQTPSVSLGAEFIAVKNGDVIEIYQTDTGQLHQSITIEQP